MTRNRIEAEVHSSSARLRVQTYEYDTPSEQVRRPSQHLLVLMSQRQPIAGCFFGSPQSHRRFTLGRLVYVPAGKAIWGYGPGGPRRFVSCAWSEGAHRAFDGFEGIWDDGELERCADVRSDWLAETMGRLAREAMEPGFGSDILVDSLTSALPVHLVRYLHAEPGAKAVRGGLTPRQLRMVDDYLRQWPAGGVTVGALAALAGLSRSHFMRAFKESTGVTVHAHVEALRFGEAQRLLSQTDMPLKRIADRLGFASAASFSLAFRRMASETPGRFRAQQAAL